MELLKKSKEILKKFQLKNGGILATPEGGAYAFIYPRDAVIISKALNVLGETERSEKFYYFMKRISKIKKYRAIFQRYTKNGLPNVTRKNQNDNEGLLIHGIYDTFIHTHKKKFLKELWPFVENLAELIFSYSKTGLVKTETSIHEFGGLEEGYEIWANCACWRGIKDASEIAKVLGKKKQSTKYLEKSKQLKRNIKSKLFNKKGFFIKKPELPETPDISQLAPFYFGLSDSEKILKTTMKYLRKHLWDKKIGGFKRFKKFDIVKNWHWYTGGDGPWCVFTLWCAGFYKKIGDKRKYNECVRWIEKIASAKNDLLPEHVATTEEYNEWKKNETEFNERILGGMKTAEKIKNKKNLIHWAVPLGWSHAEYILLKENDNT